MMKYIVVNGDNEKAILFDKHFSHKQVATTLAPKCRVLGAGFVRINDEGIECFGMSTSLDIMSRQEDTKVVIEAIS